MTDIKKKKLEQLNAAIEYNKEEISESEIRTHFHKDYKGFCQKEQNKAHLKALKNTAYSLILAACGITAGYNTYTVFKDIDTPSETTTNEKDALIYPFSKTKKEDTSQKKFQKEDIQFLQVFGGLWILGISGCGAIHLGKECPKHIRHANKMYPITNKTKQRA